MPTSSHTLTRRHLRAGVTLIEVMVAFAIAGSLMGLAGYIIQGAFATALKDQSGAMISTMKYTYNQAALNNSTYRLAINLDTGEYHTEVIKKALYQMKKTQQTLQDEDEFMTAEARDADLKDQESDSLFSQEETSPFGNRRISSERIQDGVIKPRTLKSGIRVARVFVADQDPIDEGIAYIQFYPGGFQDPAVVILKNEDGRAYSLVLEPLTGRIIARSGEVEARDVEFLNGEDEE